MRIFSYLIILLLVLQTQLIAFPISLKSNWLVKEGKNLNYSEAPDTWEAFKELTIKAKDLKNLSQKNPIEITFYKTVELTDEEVNTLPESLSLYFPFLTNVYEIYFNGVKIGGSGEIENEKVVRYGYHRNVITKIPTPLLRIGQNEIYIIASGVKGDEVAVYGNKDTALNYHSNNLTISSERISLMLLFLYAFVGLYHLLLFAKRRKELYNFYFAAFCVSLSSYLFMRSNAVYELGLDPFLMTKIEYIILFQITAFSVAFFEFFLKGKNGILTKISFVAIWLLSAPIPFITKAISSKLLLFWQIFTLITFIYNVYLMIWAIRNKNKDANRLFFGFVVLIFTAIWDILGSIGISKSITNLGLMQYGFFTFVMGIAFVLANRFLRVHNEVEELNLTLERKVEERTKELQNTLTEVQTLKLQQDGDYFLTTLLIKPLMVNEAISNKIKIEFFIKQKKSFEFKSKMYEIGGDMCIANNILLRGKKYCVFINGDAMGKSIQGAGGALVLGVVFRSIIERTKIFKPNKELFPEQWLKICFIELQNVFTSFDGSMLVSIVMGLIEENTGALFFLNAEHPWTVLYRDGKAEFLENQLYLHKVGMLVGVDGSLTIQTFQMHPGDSIIIGSDGRDDIMLGMDLDGHRNINENEDDFLRHVEDGKGELKGITDEILKQGDFTDDYTLIKLSYLDVEHLNVENPDFITIVDKGDLLQNTKDQGQAIEAYKKALEIKKDKEVIRKLLDIYFAQNNFKEFIILCEEFLEINPMESEYFFKISYAYKLEGQFSKAIDYGDCLKLREPHNIENLLNLIDINSKMGNFNRANKLLSYVMFLDPGNLKAQELQKLIEEKLILT